MIDNQPVIVPRLVPDDPRAADETMRALQSALQAASEVGGRVELPPGKFHVSAGVRIGAREV